MSLSLAHVGPLALSEHFYWRLVGCLSRLRLYHRQLAAASTFSEEVSLLKESFRKPFSDTDKVRIAHEKSGQEQAETHRTRS